MLEKIFKKLVVSVAVIVAVTVVFSQGLPYIKNAAFTAMNFSLNAAIPSAEIVSKEPESSENQKTNASSAADVSSAVAASQMSATPPEGVETGSVETKLISATTANTFYENIYLNNKTSVNINIGDILSNQETVKLTNTTDPQVLIMHTHSTEAYTENDYGYYVVSDSTRSTDPEKSVMRVGEEINTVLNNAGISTIHNTTLHDYPSYNGSYGRAADTINWYLATYPSIKVVIDCHRDAITSSDNTKVKPTVVINGKNAAQVMFVTGCETGDITDFPNWKQNLSLVLKIQKQIETDFPGLARAVYFTDCRYNMQLTSGSMLIEVGTEVNTLDEAVYSGQLVGQSIAKVLLETINN